MAVMKTPGVYVVEKDAFPSSVVEVETAVPAFIGYTERADNKGRALANKPWPIASMAEYHTYFGGPPTPLFDMTAGAGAAADDAGDAGATDDADTDADEDGNGDDAATATAVTPVVTTAGAAEVAAFSFDGQPYELSQTTQEYRLYYSMKLFFQNGGGPCYIVSVGTYEDDIEQDPIVKAFELLLKEEVPTMVVIPEAVSLGDASCIAIQQAALQHCGMDMRNRVAILDIHSGYRDRKAPQGDCVQAFRDALGVNFLNYGVAYYPWLETSAIPLKDLGLRNFTASGLDALRSALSAELAAAGLAEDDLKRRQAQGEINKIGTTESDQEVDELQKSLDAVSPQLYDIVRTEIKDKLNLMPPSAAMAGVYTMVDNTRGVWKAPANVSLSGVVKPAVNINHAEQEDLNVTPQGKSINAIRPFSGEGVLVWGGRTLDGNSLDWKYVNVRRTMIMLEESIRMAAKRYVFENNNAQTWVALGSMIGNFLTGIWKRGGLAGGSPSDAFSVHVGLGQSMTPVDILDGIMRVTVLVAITRPAEFIEITFQQKMQES